MQPEISGEPEMGWIFDPSVHGQGIAFEACTAALAWADTNLDALSYPAIISLDNAPSIRLAERLGFDRLPDGVYKDEPIAVFRRPAKRSPAAAATPAAATAGRAAAS
jgi:RimJ/RimL family protein N-acetyltransferase